MKSESKSSLGAQSSSSPVLSESEDETSTVLSNQSQASLTEPHSHRVPSDSTVVAPLLEESKDDKSITTRDLQSKKAVKVKSSKQKVTSTPLKNSLPPLTAELSAIAKQLPNSELGHKEQSKGRDTKVEGTTSQTLDSSSDLVDVTDSEMSIMSGLNFNVEEASRQRTSAQSESLPKVDPVKHTTRIELVEDGESGDASEANESGSVTVTEMSEEEIEEDIDDSGEDTMFEETLHKTGTYRLYTYVSLNLATPCIHADCFPRLSIIS